MTFYKKQDRDWHDPPTDKKISLSGIFSKKWILISLIITYALAAVQIATSNITPDAFEIFIIIIAFTVIGVFLSPFIELAAIEFSKLR